MQELTRLAMSQIHDTSLNTVIRAKSDPDDAEHDGTIVMKRYPWTVISRLQKDLTKVGGRGKWTLNNIGGNYDCVSFLHCGGKKVVSDFLYVITILDERLW